jgi:hypothetical protein
MTRGLSIALTLLSLCSRALAQTADLDALDAQAERFVWGRRIGALLLWGGLIIASVIIGVVRMRQRRQRKNQ